MKSQRKPDIEEEKGYSALWKNDSKAYSGTQQLNDDDYYVVKGKYRIINFYK